MQPGHIAALVRCHVNGLIPFKGTIKQTTKDNAPTTIPRYMNPISLN